MVCWFGQQHSRVMQVAFTFRGFVDDQLRARLIPWKVLLEDTGNSLDDFIIWVQERGSGLRSDICLVKVNTIFNNKDESNWIQDLRTETQTVLGFNLNQDMSLCIIKGIWSQCEVCKLAYLLRLERTSQHGHSACAIWNAFLVGLFGLVAEQTKW